MKLNSVQQNILITAAVLLAGLAVFVPWLDCLYGSHSSPGGYSNTYNLEEQKGYSLIIAPPKSRFERGGMVRVDWPRVLVPMLVVVIAAGVGFVLAGQYAPPASPSSTAIRSGEPPHRA